MTSPSTRRFRFGAHLSLLAIAAFVGLSLWAHWSPAFGQEVKKKKGPAAKALEPAKKASKPVTPPVSLTKGKKLEAAELAQLIDQAIDNRLKEEKVPVSEKSSDAEFLRRVHLDLLGVIPTSEKVKSFLEDKNPKKREAVVEELLKDARFGKYHAEQWSGLMLPRESNNRLLNHGPLRKWLAEGFTSNKPLNKLVFELVTATGDQDENGATTYFVGNPTVDKITDSVSRMFLGVQLQCAQCHNHPFVDWKQNEYWAMAAFFMKVRLSATPQAAAKKGITPGITETTMAKGKKGALPESAKIVPAKFLQGDSPTLDSKEPYRPVLAKWMTSADNPFFARAMVNRWWYTLLGRGLVNPVDDMHEDNVATHADLLDALTEQFKMHDFDLQYLLKSICLSDAYQRTTRPLEGNKDDKDLYSHRLVRVMTSEQLYDSLAAVVGIAKGPDRIDKKGVVPKKGPGNARDQFLAFFRIDEGADPLEYQTGIPQALRLMNSGALNNFTGTIARASAESKEPAKVIENLFLTVYSRRPAEAEVKHFTDYVGRQATPQAAYGDILWALVNSSEFSLNH